MCKMEAFVSEILGLVSRQWEEVETRRPSLFTVNELGGEGGGCLRFLKYKKKRRRRILETEEVNEPSLASVQKRTSFLECPTLNGR